MYGYFLTFFLKRTSENSDPLHLISLQLPSSPLLIQTEIIHTAFVFLYICSKPSLTQGNTTLQIHYQHPHRLILCKTAFHPDLSIQCIAIKTNNSGELPILGPFTGRKTMSTQIPCSVLHLISPSFLLEGCGREKLQATSLYQMSSLRQRLRPVGKHFDSLYRGYFVCEMESVLLQVKRDRKA